MNALLRTRWDVAEAKANELTEPYSAPPIPVHEIAEHHGVNIVFADFGALAEKVSGVCDFNAARIYVNQDDSSQRQAFTMAHELGHWVLHRDFFLKEPDKYPVFPRFSDVDKHNKFEQEANSFAANLLVPYRLLRPVVNAPVSKLAAIFGVSKTMMEFRVRNVR